MQNINTWKLNNNLCNSNDKIIDNIKTSIRNGTNPTYLLDLTKNKYTFIEKYVYDIAMFHFARLNIHNIDNHYVEFWFKSQVDNHELHVDCDECLKQQGKYQYPILASVTYLNDFYNNPTIITNIDNDTYKNKDFNTQTEIILSLPKCNKHITFNGRFFHGSTQLSDIQYTTSRYLLAINLWDKLPLTDIDHCNKFDTSSDLDMNNLFDKKHSIVSIKPDDTIGYVNVDNNIINYKLFDDILYNGKYNTACYIFNDLIKKYYSINDTTITTFKFILGKPINETKPETKLKPNVIHTFIINLKSDINRRLSIVNKLKYTNIKNYTIIDAVDGRNELDKYDFKVMPDWVDPLLQRKINAGEIGCFLSHYFIWKYIKTHNIGVALILEDDCVFLKDFNNKFNQILQLRPTTYDYFTLGRMPLWNFCDLKSEIVIDGDYVIPKYSYNSQSYLVTNSGANILANELAIKHIIPVDEYISIMYDSFPISKYSDYFKNLPKLKAIGLVNDITDQEPDTSSATSILNQLIVACTPK